MLPPRPYPICNSKVLSLYPFFLPYGSYLHPEHKGGWTLLRMVRLVTQSILIYPLNLKMGDGLV